MSELQPRDEALMVMWEAGWANTVSGELGSPTGRFARVSNYPEELFEVGQAFRDDLSRLGVAARELLGHYLLREVEANDRSVTEYPNVEALMNEFEALRAEYLHWKRGY